MIRRGMFPIALLACCWTAGCSSPVPPPPAATQSPATAEEKTEPVAQKDDAPPDEPFVLEDGFQALTLADFDSFGAESETWAGQDDRIVCRGKPKGYLYSKQPYQNFTWRLEYRFPRPKSLADEEKFKGNTGFLVYITGEHKLWPVCIEVQGKHVQMASLRENGGAAPVTVHEDETQRLTARKPVGQWNQVEITSKDGALSVTLNGQPVTRSEANFLSEGLLGIQAEDHPFEVRRMRVRRE